MKKIIQKINILCNILPKLDNKEFFFFFPYYHLGGAETVHNDILKIFKDFNSICFITEKSVNNFNKSLFESNMFLLEVYKYSRKKVRLFLLKKIAEKINKTDNPRVFGCNSMFFYDLIPFLKDHVKVIDLLHAFSYEEPNASEKYSLPVASRINKRIVLGQKTKNDFKELYKTNNKDSKLINRIEIIKNKVSIPEMYNKKDLSKITILFVGRDSYEKRPHLFLKSQNEH
ncbi:hypothetical protein ACSLMG_11115 [Flavobacterium columnare]|uniref:hypothetical protein n=1 Tax=Flavobacterium columnare TaxID=996 RepID=UPI004033CE62